MLGVCKIILNPDYTYVMVSWVYGCRRGSVVEHTLGKGGVESSILSGGTSFKRCTHWRILLHEFSKSCYKNEEVRLIVDDLLQNDTHLKTSLLVA